MWSAFAQSVSLDPFLSSKFYRVPRVEAISQPLTHHLQYVDRRVWCIDGLTWILVRKAGEC